MEKFCRAEQATDDNTAHAHCMLDNYHYNTHSEYVIPVAFPLQQWLHERVSLLRYAYSVCLFLSLVVWLILCVSASRDLVDLLHIHDLFGVEGRCDCLLVSEDSDIICASGACKNANLTIFVQEVILSLFVCGFSCHNATRQTVKVSIRVKHYLGVLRAVLMTIQVFRDVLRLYRCVSTTEPVMLSFSCYRVESPMRESQWLKKN